MIRSLKITVNKYALIYTVVILSFVPAPYLHRIVPMIMSIESIVKMATLVYVIMALMGLKTRAFKDRVFFGIFVFGAYLFIPTLLYAGSFTDYFRTLWNVFVFVLFMGIVLNRKPAEFMESCCIVFGMYILVNTISTIAFPAGLYDTVSISGIFREEASYFLGHKNNVLNYMMPGILCICYKNYLQYKKIRLFTWIYVAGVYCCCMIGQSVTSTIAFSVVVLSLILSRKELFSRFINIYTALLLNFLFFIFIVVLRMQERFSYFLISLVGKGLDMNGRTYIWDKGLVGILQHPFVGHGIEPTDNILSSFLINNDSFHNLILDYLYEGGIIGLLIFILLFFFLARKIDQYDDIQIKNLCNSVIFSISIIWLLQPTTRARMLLIFIPVLLISFICNEPVREVKERDAKDLYSQDRNGVCI